ncbi:hypothetical protein VB264_05300 [Arcicella aquatica]|uniref:Uncharacterized protein n=1 Tax=Arcicella aquatica TaxID=217141 RepID=A0ABU5QJI1_9BACT|nr:hypothetical protein [Arcicella aquatica]MEA5257193.1 hypothetical protein [Arcicella aquatica]
MKNLVVSFIFLLAGLVLGASVLETGNVFQGLLAVGAVTSALGQVTGSVLPAEMFFCVSLTTVPKSPCNKVNPGGNKKWLVCATEDFSRAWPEEADVDTTTGAIITPIPLKVGKAFAEIEFTDNTAKADYAKEGESGHESYKHMAEAKISGYNSTQWLALRKFLNMRFVLIVKHGDKNMVVYSHSEDGFALKESHTTGLKGSDKREFTIKMDQDGLAMAPPILGAAVNVPVLI